MSSEIKTLADEFVEEQKRVLELYGKCRARGGVGEILGLALKDVLDRSFEVVIAQDLPAMLKVYQELKAIKE